MARHNQLKANNGKGDSLTVTEHNTDAPLLPVGDMERLHKFRPDLNDFVIEQTKIEGDYRRGLWQEKFKVDKKINNFVFAERVLGMLLAGLIGSLGIIGGGYLVLHDHDVAGASIASVTIGTLAVAFLTRHNKKQETKPPK